MEVSRSVPTSETLSNEQDRSQVVLRAMFNGKRLMIIKLGKYNSAEALHIDTRTTGSQGHICYQNRDRRVSVARAAVRMGVEEMGCKQDTGVHTNRLQVRNEHRDTEATVEQSKKH